MIFCLLITLFGIITLFFCYIRLKYKFWRIQPVFHFYDLYYWFVNVGIINLDLPEKNKYVNLKHIETMEFDNLSTNKLTEFVMFIQMNFLSNIDNKYLPTINNIKPYFKNHNSKSFVSIYWEPILLLNNKTNIPINDKKMIGVITSRPMHILINDKYNNINKFNAYYVDYLCVDKHYRKKNIAPQLIQTHEYNQRRLNNNIYVSLFKREGELTGIIPLTTFNTCCFKTESWYNEPLPFNPSIALLVGDTKNLYYLYDLILLNTIWDITILPEISNIIELVTTQNMYIYMVVINDEIQCGYIFKRTKTFLEKDKEVLSCICSIKGVVDDNIFIQGFKLALWNILKSNKKFCYIALEDISNNNILIQNLTIKTKPYIVSPTAYFFYNFAYEPFKSNKACILI